jgi:hypothetical protein
MSLEGSSASEAHSSSHADLPPALVSLVRQIARDCAAPGRYTITLEVPDHKRRPRTAEISRVERIRILEIKQGER